jgi:tetratricopeptide (TPR) repeat protein
MKLQILSTMFLLAGLALYGEAAPQWFVPLRDAVYAQAVPAGQIEPLYREAVKKAEADLSGENLYVMLSRCEYMLGKAYQLDERNDEAISCYEKGITLAEKSIALRPTAAAYEMLSSHYGQACMLKSRAWVMANGLAVEQNAKKALALDPRNTACRYMISSRWVFGPGVFGNPQRGITELEAILEDGLDLQKDDFFNVYSALGYAYIRLKKNQDALPWIKKSLSLYPTNKFALGLLDQAS